MLLPGINLAGHCFCMSWLIVLASGQVHDFSGRDLFYLYGFLMGTGITLHPRACRLSSKPCPRDLLPAPR